MNTRRASKLDRASLAPLIAAFRVEIARVRGKTRKPDMSSARRELSEYFQKRFPIFVAIERRTIVGYIVCRVDPPTVWAEQLYVLPAFRRLGIASALYARAETLARRYGSETVYNWVDPENDAIIKFLAGRGYDVLNLIELRRPRRGEKPARKLRVGAHLLRR